MTSGTASGAALSAPSPQDRSNAPAAGRRRRRVREALTGYAFVLPAVALFGVMGLYTVGYGLALSFARWNGFSPNWTWVGFGNYLDLLYRDPILAPQTRDDALRTLLVMVAVPILTIAVGFPLAVALNRIRFLRATFRTVFFLPNVTAGIAVFYAWMYVLQPDGSLNYILRHLGLGTLSQPQGFLGNPSTALATLVVVMSWGAIPVAMILYLTGLQAIDTSVIDAARTDGAGELRMMRSIMWPLLRPITAAVILLNMRDALQGFQIFLIMTNGGPGGHTEVLGLEAYNLAFFDGLKPTLGLSSALGWMLFVIALILAGVNLRVLRSRT